MRVSYRAEGSQGKSPEYCHKDQWQQEELFESEETTEKEEGPGPAGTTVSPQMEATESLGGWAKDFELLSHTWKANE